MAITIKEIHVKTTIERAAHTTALSPEQMAKLKQSIVNELKEQEYKKNKMRNER